MSRFSKESRPTAGFAGPTILGWEENEIVSVEQAGPTILGWEENEIAYTEQAGPTILEWEEN